MRISGDFRIPTLRQPQRTHRIWTEPVYYEKDEGFFRNRKIVTYERQPELCRFAKGAVAAALGSALPYAAGAPPALSVLGGIAGLTVGYVFWGGDRKVGA